MASKSASKSSLRSKISSKTLPKNAKKTPSKVLNKGYDKKFVRSTLTFGALMMLGFGAMLAFNSQGQIAKAFDPGEVVTDSSDISDTICYNQRLDGKEVKKGDKLTCIITLKDGFENLNLTSYKYFAWLADGNETNTDEFGNSIACTFESSDKKLICTDISTKEINSGDAKNIYLGVSYYDLNQVYLIDTNYKISVK